MLLQKKIDVCDKFVSNIHKGFVKKGVTNIIDRAMLTLWFIAGHSVHSSVSISEVRTGSQLSVLGASSHIFAVPCTLLQ